MRSYPDCSNAFSPSFLERVNERDEPPTAGGADAAGPWRVEPIPGLGFGLDQAAVRYSRAGGLYGGAAVQRRRRAPP